MGVAVVTRTPISFEAADGPTHAPLVRGTVGGIETLLVLDTGADVHLLNKDLVDRIGLDVEEGEEGVDHSGATMPSWAVDDVDLALGGVVLTLRDVVSIPAPARFASGGIGGGLSPQHLHPTAVTVIDQLVDELLLVDGSDDAVASWLAERSPSLTTLSLPRDPAFATVVVPAAVRPFEEQPTLLNTGGKGTEFSRAVVPGLGEGPDARLGSGVSGADVMGAAGGAQVVVIGGHEIPVEELAVRNDMPDPQGMLGADVLRGTVLACAADPTRRVLFQIPG